MNTHDKEILICTLDGYKYFLGPEYNGELDWHDAKRWCNSLGEDYELPSRLIMLAICKNEATAALLTNNKFYWTSEEVDDTPSAWVQHWNSSAPGFQYIARKFLAHRLRVVRRCRVEEN